MRRRKRFGRWCFPLLLTGMVVTCSVATAGQEADAGKSATPRVAATGTAPVTVEMTTAGGVTYNPSAIVALSARVLSGSGGTVPTGTVQFYDQSVGGSTGPAVTLDSDGNAMYSESGQFSIGGHNIVAIYSGDGTYESETSQPITINIQPSPTTLVVTPSTTAPAGGSAFTVTGTVTSSNPGNSPPTGTLTINLDGIPQGNVQLSTTDGVASGSVKVTAPTAGTHNVQGFYAGDVNYNNSTSQSVAITVAKGATVTSIAATPSTLTAGVPETFTATIAPAGTVTGSYTITGSVSFYDGATLLGTAAINGNAAVLPGIVLSTSSVHTITASYSGDANWAASVSSPLLLSPILLPVTVTLVSNASLIGPGQSATYTVTVTPLSAPPAAGEQHPTGSVLLYAGTKLVGSAMLTAGVGYTGTAVLSLSQLTAGSYSITAQYVGDATFGPAVSNALSLAVEDFTVACNVNNVNVVQGQTATVTCDVASLGGLTGQIQVVCVEQNPPLTAVIGCTFDPTVITGSGQTTLTIVTTAGNISQNGMRAGGVALAIAGLLFVPIGRRARWLRGRAVMLVLLLVGLAGAGLGCGSSTKAVNVGTPLGVHTLKITAAAVVNTVTVSHYSYLTVNVTP